MKNYYNEWLEKKEKIEELRIKPEENYLIHSEEEYALVTSFLNLVYPAFNKESGDYRIKDRFVSKYEGAGEYEFDFRGDEFRLARLRK